MKCNNCGEGVDFLTKDYRNQKFVAFHRDDGGEMNKLLYDYTYIGCGMRSPTRLQAEAAAQALASKCTKKPQANTKIKQEVEEILKEHATAASQNTYVEGPHTKAALPEARVSALNEILGIQQKVNVEIKR